MSEYGFVKNSKGFHISWDDFIDKGYARKFDGSVHQVYSALCRHADKEHFCYPSHQVLANELGLCRTTVWRAINVLEKWGIIKVIPTQQGKSLSYLLQLPTEWKTLPKSDWIRTVKHNPTCLMVKHPLFNGYTPPVEPVNTKVTHLREHNKEGKKSPPSFIQELVNTHKTYTKNSNPDWTKNALEDFFNENKDINPDDIQSALADPKYLGWNINKILNDLKKNYPAHRESARARKIKEQMASCQLCGKDGYPKGMIKVETGSKVCECSKLTGS